MNGFPWNSPPRTTTKSSSSAAAQLLRRGGRGPVKEESIEFFSDLRMRQPEQPDVSGGQAERRPADGKGGKVRQRGGGDELLTTEIGKHDYDWLMTPPATPLPSRTTTSAAPAPAGHQAPAAAPSPLARSRSMSFAKTNPRLPSTSRENGNAKSRLSRSSSAGNFSASTPAATAPSRVRTLPINSGASDVFGGYIAPLWPADAASPRTPPSARSAAALYRARDKSLARQVLTPKWPRPRPTTEAASSTNAKSTTQEPALDSRGANAAARSRMSSSHNAAGSTAQSGLPAPRVVAPPPSIKLRPVQTAATQCQQGKDAAAASTATTQRRRPSSSPVFSTSPRCGQRAGPSASTSSSRTGDGRKINVQKAAPRRPAGLASAEFAAPRRTAGLASAVFGDGLARSGSRRPANADANLSGAMRGGGPANLKPTAQQRSMIASRIRSGSMAASADAGSIARGRSASEKGKPTAASADAGSIARGRSASEKGKPTAAAAAGRVSRQDVFPSTRYDAMLLREDPKNLTWLKASGEDKEDDGGRGGAGLVDGSLEPFSAATGRTSGPKARF